MSQKHNSLSWIETYHSQRIFQLITHTRPGSARTWPNSQLAVFAAEPLMPSQTTNREKLYLFKREHDFLAQAGHRKQLFEKVPFSAYSYSQEWKMEKHQEPQLMADWRQSTDLAGSLWDPAPGTRDKLGHMFVAWLELYKHSHPRGLRSFSLNINQIINLDMTLMIQDFKYSHNVAALKTNIR